MNDVKKRLIEDAPILLAVVDGSLICRMVSKVWRARLGLAGTGAIAIPVATLFDSDTDTTVQDQIVDVAKGGAVIHEVEVCVPTQEGIPTHGQLSAWQFQLRQDTSP